MLNFKILQVHNFKGEPGLPNLNMYHVASNLIQLNNLFKPDMQQQIWLSSEKSESEHD